MKTSIARFHLQFAGWALLCWLKSAFGQGTMDLLPTTSMGLKRSGEFARRVLQYRVSKRRDPRRTKGCRDD